mgnify:CR=1 FL=1
MGTPHNHAEIGDIAEKVLLPGDPMRAKFIAENFLKDAILKCWFGTLLTTQWQWLSRCLGVFIQTMRSM